MKRADMKKRLPNVKQVNREMARESAKYHDIPAEIPRDQWPEFSEKMNPDFKPIACWRSKKFFIQVVEEPKGALRISVNRTRFNDDYDYVDGITWDELFEIKNHIGYAEHDCIEIYPAERDLVNVSNIRHLFVLPEKHPYNWNNK